MIDWFYYRIDIIISQAQRSCWVIHWFQSVCLSIRPSLPRPSRITCPLCSAYSSSWIHFIFMHLTKQPRCVVCKFLAKFQFLAFFLIWNFDFVLFWLGIWCESLVWVIMGRWGVSQNAGILVVLVYCRSQHFAIFKTFAKKIGIFFKFNKDFLQ